MTNDETLSRYVQTLADMIRAASTNQSFFYKSTYEFVLDAGTRHEPAPKPRNVAFGPVRNCFQNAWNLAHRGANLTYAEGYALSSVAPMPVHHAWCVSRDGQVIDNTWREPGLAYLGVEFNLSFVAQTILRRGYYGVIDNMEMGFPLLRKKWAKPGGCPSLAEC